MGVGPEDRTTKASGRLNEGSDDSRATFAESNTNFAEGIFQIMTSEGPGSSWRSLSYKKKYCERIPAVMDV